jgi:hypothetical protein
MEPHGMGDLSMKITNKKLIKSFCGGSRGAVFSKRAPLAAGGKLAFWVKSKVPFYVFFSILYLIFIWVLHLHLPIYHKTNDILNDGIFSEPVEGEAFPDNIILIDIEQWPYYKDNRQEAQTARDEVVTRMIEIIDLLNKDPKKKPPFIGIDMTFESFAKEDIMKQLLERIKQQDNIFLSVEIDRENKSLKFPDNFFWNKIKENIEKIRERLTIVSLEKYKDEPVRRYKTFYKAAIDDKGPVFNFPSMGTVIAKMLNRYYLGDTNQLEVPDQTSRFRFRYLIQNIKEDFQKYHVLASGGQGVKREAEKIRSCEDKKLRKFPVFPSSSSSSSSHLHSFGPPAKTFNSPSGSFSKCIVIFGRIDPDPDGRDRFPVCAFIKEDNIEREATLPGVMIHINAAQSILLKENIRPMGKWQVLVYLILLLLLILIPIHIFIEELLARWKPGMSHWYAEIFLFFAFGFFVIFLDGLLRKQGNSNLEIPMFTFYMFVIKFYPVLGFSKWVYSRVISRKSKKSLKKKEEIKNAKG